MNKAMYAIVAGFFCLVTQVYSQISESAKSPSSTLNEIIWGTGVTNGNGLKPGEMVAGVPVPAGEVIGEELVSTGWLNGVLTLWGKNQPLAISFDYNYDTRELFVKNRGVIYRVDDTKVKQIEWRDTSTGNRECLINSNILRNGSVYRGFLRPVDTVGYFKLYQTISIQVKKPNYNVALQTGSRDFEIQRRYNYFLTEGDEPMIEMKGKKWVDRLKTSKQEISEYLKGKKIDYENEDNLVDLVHSINRIYQSR